MWEHAHRPSWVQVNGLGCGLAGGDWDTVLDIISDAAKAWNLNVEIWELQK